MTGNNNQLSDKDIHNLFKRRLLEQVEDDDSLTQKLMDMEAKLVFSNEALLVPSLQKENELLKKLVSAKGGSTIFKWILPALFVALVSTVLYYYFQPKSTFQAAANNIPAAPKQNNSPITIQTHTIESTDSTVAHVSTIVLTRTDQETVVTDTIIHDVAEKWTIGDPGIKVNYKPSLPKTEPDEYKEYDGTPVLSEKEEAWTKKAKEKLVKEIIKLDKKVWAYIPTSTKVIYGDTVSAYGFYMATKEVTNNNYRIFLNDLIMHDKIDDFLKAVPDTAKWLINGKLFYEPMRKMYYWHPAYNDFPVVNVSRTGAKMYCDWLTNAVNDKIKETNPKEKWESLFINDVRIPAEEEWMIAASGGLGNVPFPWTITPDRTSIQNLRGCYLCNFSIVNYPDSLKKLCQCADDKLKNAITSAGTVKGDFYFTAKVDSYNPNDYGLYCMCGNVAEMVWQYKTNRPCAKGGSWNSDADQVKINAQPELVNVTEGSPYLGFRPVFTFKKRQ